MRLKHLKPPPSWCPCLCPTPTTLQSWAAKHVRAWSNLQHPSDRQTLQNVTWDMGIQEKHSNGSLALAPNNLGFLSQPKQLTNFQHRQPRQWSGERGKTRLENKAAGAKRLTILLHWEVRTTPLLLSSVSCSDSSTWSANRAGHIAWIILDLYVTSISIKD